MQLIGNTRAAILVLLCLTVARAAAAQETVLHNFGHSSSGGLVTDGHGNLFDTTEDAGTAIGGSVIELSPVAGGAWTETVVYHFGAFPTDGLAPTGALTTDESGHLFGTTSQGGTKGNGTVFEISPTAVGGWSERVLYNFPASGSPPSGGLVLDAQGNLYGTTQQGGTNDGTTGPFGYGTAFELTQSAEGRWTENVLHDFGASSTDGVFPTPGLTIDSSGNLYGTTFEGGAYSAGTVFKVSRQDDGSWTEQVLHSFNSSSSGGDGYYPVSGLLLDVAGNLYGATEYGGQENTGTIFELSPSNDGAWMEKLLSSFTALDSGVNPAAGLTQDAAGNLYGTTTEGGLYQGDQPASEPAGGGTVYTLRPQADGSWTQTVLHNFPSTPTDGYDPQSTVVLDGEGNLYSSTGLGGSEGFGTIFELGGVASAAVAETQTLLVANTGNNLVAGEPIKLTATVSPVSGQAIPTGMVTFADPAGGSATVPLIAGVAVYSGRVPPAGTYSVFASYSGGAGFASSKSATISSTVAPSKE